LTLSANSLPAFEFYDVALGKDVALVHPDFSLRRLKRALAPSREDDGGRAVHPGQRKGMGTPDSGPSSRDDRDESHDNVLRQKSWQ
jgi:hypothetical protein